MAARDKTGVVVDLVNGGRMFIPASGLSPRSLIPVSAVLTAAAYAAIVYHCFYGLF